MSHKLYHLDEEDVRRLREAGMGTTEIAAHLKVPYATVWKFLHRIGILRVHGDKPQPGYCRGGHDLSIEGTKLVNKGPGRSPCWICVACDRERRARSIQRKKAAAQSNPVCAKGHSKADYGSPNGCRLCAQQRAYAMHRARLAKQPPPPPQQVVAAKYTWFDYADALDRDFGQPHWLHTAPAIKEYLLKNKIVNT